MPAAVLVGGTQQPNTTRQHSWLSLHPSSTPREKVAAHNCSLQLQTFGRTPRTHQTRLNPTWWEKGVQVELPQNTLSHFSPFPLAHSTAKVSQTSTFSAELSRELTHVVAPPYLLIRAQRAARNPSKTQHISLGSSCRSLLSTCAKEGYFQPTGSAVSKTPLHTQRFHPAAC